MSQKQMLCRPVYVLAVALLFAPQVSQAQDAISAPAQKQIGAAKTEMVPSLIVMNSRGASLQGNTLTLNGVSSNSIVFADRPVRAAGHALTSQLLEEWTPTRRAATTSPRIRPTQPFQC